MLSAADPHMASPSPLWPMMLVSFSPPAGTHDGSARPITQQVPHGPLYAVTFLLHMSGAVPMVSNTESLGGPCAPGNAHSPKDAVLPGSLNGTATSYCPLARTA